MVLGRLKGASCTQGMFFNIGLVILNIKVATLGENKQD